MALSRLLRPAGASGYIARMAIRGSIIRSALLWQLVGCAGLLALWPAPSGPVLAQTGATPAALLPLNDEIRRLRQPPTIEGVPDHSQATEAERRKALTALRARHAAIVTSEWKVPDRVDHLLVLAQLNALDFDLRVSRPWERDPGYWVDMIARHPYATTPVPAAQRQRVLDQLRSVPRVLEEARRQLTHPAGELAGMAIAQLSRSDGVNQGEPRRDPPPEGVLGWYDDLLARAKVDDPSLVPDIQQARTAVQQFRDWLVAERPRMQTPAAIGLEEFQWFVRNVRMVPITLDELRTLGDRELERARTLLVTARQRNRGLPELVPVTTAEEHEQRTREAERWIREFTKQKGLLTLPDDLPAEYPTDAFFINRAAWGGHRHFWEELTYRDPLNNHIHASIPGHRVDTAMQRRHPSPIRRTFSDGTRNEGWTYYLEDMYLQAGLLDDRPRARELFYIAQIKRAARIPAELAMQSGRWTLQQAVDYLVAEVPFMEENLARYDLGIYLRRPAYGLNYAVGRAQMERLVSDRSRQMGAAFDLGRFHDEFLTHGGIPITLIRWEMTGLDDEVRALGLIAGR
jgi:hypothetical protein